MTMGARAPQDERWMASVLALSMRGLGQTAPNPPVGCVIVSEGRVIGRGWTQPGGRPHAEAMALEQAGAAARGATAYVTLEPCAHESRRGSPCADGLISAGLARVVVALGDPFPAVNGRGLAALRTAGIAVDLGVGAAAAGRIMAGFLMRQRHDRAHVTLKLATALDGAIALANGESRWITGDAARAHAHLLRAHSDAILVGRTTWETDSPALDVRLPGLEARAPRRLLLSSRLSASVEGVTIVATPHDAVALAGINDLLVEGGAETAASFLKAGLVDRLVLYRAPILIGGGRPCLGDIGLSSLAQAHGRWHRMDRRQLGDDCVEIFEAA